MISIRDKVDQLEVVVSYLLWFREGVADKQSWNDYGESSYIGPIDGDMPSDVRYYVNNNCKSQSTSALLTKARD
jgi:hypothetical protein